MIVSEALTMHFMMANKVGGVRGCGWMTCVACTVTMEDATTLGVLSVEHAKNVCQKWWWMRTHLVWRTGCFTFTFIYP